MRHPPQTTGRSRSRGPDSSQSRSCSRTACTPPPRSTRFEPTGFTGNQEIPIATSIMDYLFRWLALRFPAEGTSPLVERHPAARGAQLDLPRVPLLSKDFIEREALAASVRHLRALELAR